MSVIYYIHCIVCNCLISFNSKNNGNEKKEYLIYKRYNLNILCK